MFTVLIDNGHGANTPGKRSPLKEDGTRLYEWEYTREIAKVLKAVLLGKGYNVILITPEEYDLSISKRTKRINKYVSKYGARNCVMVSIHLNAAGNNDKWLSARGWSAYTTPGLNNSDKLAECLYEYADIILNNDSEYVDSFKLPSILKPIRRDTTDGDSDIEANFLILRESNCPAVLTENLFLDNRIDVAYLESRQGFNNIIEIHARGIEKFFNTYRK